MSWEISCGFKNLDKLGSGWENSKTPCWYYFFKNGSKLHDPWGYFWDLISEIIFFFYLPFIKTQHLQDQHGGRLMIFQTFILHPQHKPFVFFAFIFTCMSFYRVRTTKVERVYQSLPFTKFYNKLGTWLNYSNWGGGAVFAYDKRSRHDQDIVLIYLGALSHNKQVFCLRALRTYNLI